MRKQDFPFGPLGFEMPGNLKLDLPKPGSDLAGQFHDDLRPLNNDPRDAEIDKPALLILLRQWFSGWWDYV